MKKFSKKYVYYHLLIDFFIALFFSFFLMGNFSELENEHLSKTFAYIFIALFIAIYAILAIYHYLFYKTSSYELLDNGICCKRGVIFKKKTRLDYSKIHAVTVKEGIIQKLFGICAITIDSGSTNTSVQEEIVIIESTQEAQKLTKEINERQKHLQNQSDEEPIVNEEEGKQLNSVYTFNTPAKLMYSFLNTLLALFMIFIFMVLALIAISVLSQFVNVEGYDFTGNFFIDLLILFTLILFIVIVFSFIANILNSFFKYHNFEIKKNDKELFINYGLFVRKNNSFLLKRIKAVVIEQSLFERLFHFATIYLEVVGYNDQQSNNGGNDSLKGIFIPLCKEKQINEILGHILPDYVPITKDGQAKKFGPFVLWPLLITSCVLGTILINAMLILGLLHIDIMWLLISLGIIVAIWIISFIIILINAAFAYRNQCVWVGSDKLTLYNGSITKKCTIILRSNVTSIETYTTPMRKRKGIYSFKIHYFTNSYSNVVTVNHVDQKHIESLNNFIIM